MWPWKRKRRTSDPAQVQTELTYLRSSWLSDGCWHDWCDHRPPRDVLIRVRRVLIDYDVPDVLRIKASATSVLYAKDLPLEFNIANVYWSYTGIGKMQLENRR